MPPRFFIPMTTGFYQLIFYRLPVLIYCAAIFVQSSFPASKTITEIFSSDKLLHMAGYALLGALFLRALSTFPIKNKGSLLFLSILCAALYGVTDEVHQYFVPSRNADIWDVLADTIGSFLGVTTYYLMGRVRELQKL